VKIGRCEVAEKSRRALRDSSQPPFCPKLADRAQNSLNIVTSSYVHVYRIWSGSAALCRTYSGRIDFSVQKVTTIILVALMVRRQYTGMHAVMVAFSLHLERQTLHYHSHAALHRNVAIFELVRVFNHIFNCSCKNFIDISVQVLSSFTDTYTHKLTHTLLETIPLSLRYR